MSFLKAKKSARSWVCIWLCVPIKLAEFEQFDSLVSQDFKTCIPHIRGVLLGVYDLVYANLLEAWIQEGTRGKSGPGQTFIWPGCMWSTNGRERVSVRVWVGERLRVGEQVGARVEVQTGFCGIYLEPHSNYEEPNRADTSTLRHTIPDNLKRPHCCCPFCCCCCWFSASSTSCLLQSSSVFIAANIVAHNFLMRMVAPL